MFVMCARLIVEEREKKFCARVDVLAVRKAQECRCVLPTIAVSPLPVSRPAIALWQEETFWFSVTSGKQRTIDAGRCQSRLRRSDSSQPDGLNLSGYRAKGIIDSLSRELSVCGEPCFLKVVSAITFPTAQQVHFNCTRGHTICPLLGRVGAGSVLEKPGGSTQPWTLTGGKPIPV